MWEIPSREALSGLVTVAVSQRAYRQERHTEILRCACRCQVAVMKEDGAVGLQTSGSCWEHH